MRAIGIHAAIVAITLCLTAGAHGSEIWSGLTYTFEKEAFADWSDPSNQDRITDNVWITRGDSRGIFNIAQEAAYQGFDTSGPSPVDTEWAFGTTADIGTLTFDTWAMTAAGSPPSLVGQDMVVHLVTDDIYVDIKFLSWGQGGGAGGSFSYIRAVPEPTSIILLSLAGLLIRRR